MKTVLARTLALLLSLSLCANCVPAAMAGREEVLHGQKQFVKEGGKARIVSGSAGLEENTESVLLTEDSHSGFSSTTEGYPEEEIEGASGSENASGTALEGESSEGSEEEKTAEEEEAVSEETASEGSVSEGMDPEKAGADDPGTEVSGPEEEIESEDSAASGEDPESGSPSAREEEESDGASGAEREEISGETTELPAPSTGESSGEGAAQEEELSIQYETQVFDGNVIIGFEDLGESAFVNLEYKLSTVELQKLFPEKIGIRLGGTVYYERKEDGSLTLVRAENYETKFVEVSWSCLENYDDVLNAFHFTPVLEEYSLAEALELPQIAVRVEGKRRIPVLMPIQEKPVDDLDVPVVGALSSDGSPIRRGSFPAEYNLYSAGLLPAIRDQGSYGTCWAHASTGSMEADLIHDGKAGTDIDLSELHTIYFTYHGYYDEKGCNVGDKVDPDRDYLYNGGNSSIAYKLLANMVGSVLEKDVPYGRAKSYAPNASDGRALNAVQLTGAYEMNSMDLDAVKNAIMKHGGVSTAINADEDYYSYDHNSYYYPAVSGTNHEIMLVGWDDNFSSKNFIKEPQPDPNSGRQNKNGAWLVRNSWGEEGYSFFGYFWLSYHDKSLADTVYAFDADDSPYDYCYAYNSIPFISWCPTSDTGMYSGTQTFYVDAWEEIGAVGVQTLDPQIDVEVLVKCGDETVSARRGTGYPGYYLIPLDKTISVSERSEVSVTVTFRGEGRVRYPIESDSLNYGGTAFSSSCGSDGLLLGDGSWDGYQSNTGHDGCTRLFTRDLKEAMRKDISECEVTLSSNVFTYDGKAKNPEFTVKDNETGAVLISGSDYTAVYKDNIDAGTAAVVITGAGNYKGSRRVTFEIEAKKVTPTIELSNSSFVYNGKQHKPSVKVYAENKLLVEGTDYASSYSSNINAGTAVMKVTCRNNYKGTAETTFTIDKAEQPLAAKAEKNVISVGKTTAVKVSGAKGEVSWQSSDTKTATVSGTGQVKAVKVGTVKIKVSAYETGNYLAASKTVTIKIVPGATSSLTAVNTKDGIKLTWKKVIGATGYIVYAGSSKLAAINKGTTVTFTDKKAKNGAVYTYKVIAKASTGVSTLSKSLKMCRLTTPAAFSVNNSSSKTMTVNWEKNSKADGYQIQYSTIKTFASGSKTVPVKGANVLSKEIGNLAKKKTYYVRVRCYKKVEGKAKYSAWSASKAILIVY